MKCDLLIKNVKIIDGTSTPWFAGDVAVCGDRICHVGRLSEKELEETEKGLKPDNIIDGKGKYLAPGFIDTHTHLDLTPFACNNSQDPRSERRLRQGITTQITGCCGITAAPVTEANKQEWLEQTFGIHDSEELLWNGFGEYLDSLEKMELGVNFAGYVGHGAIRHCVMGNENRKASAAEMEQMKKLLEEAMEGGAIGMSSGLIYAPGVFSDTEELVELCSVLSRYNGIYASHIRSESKRWIESVAEVIEVCEKNRIPGIVHHLKTKLKNSKEVVPVILKMIEDARKRGVDVVFEQYPYEASATGLDVVLSSWMHEGGKDAVIQLISDKNRFEELRDSIRSDYGWSDESQEWEGSRNMLVLSAEGHPEYVGKTVDVIADELGLTPVEAVFRILIETDMQSGAAFFGIKDEDICTIMSSHNGMIGSDSDDCKVGETTHPRTNGTFPRVLKHYALDRGIIPLEEAVFKMTGFPAARFALKNRGLIKEGFFADMVLFDGRTLQDNPTYLEPFARPQGIERVWVNGQTSLEGGEPTGILCGRVLRYNDLT